MRRLSLTALDIALSVGAATGLIVLLDPIAPLGSLGSLYLLAVLFVAIRRDQPAALITAVLSVAVLNYFFIEPLHRLTISNSENVVALVVLLIAALVVSRLATMVRRKASEAGERAERAAAREREAMILAEAASALLAGGEPERQIARVSESIDSASEGALRLELGAAPSTRDREQAVPLPGGRRPAWLYARRDAPPGAPDAGRLAEPLARLLDVAVERAETAARAAEAEASRRADVAKTAILHAISHDLRSPLTAIRTAANGLDSDVLSDDDREALLGVIDVESERLGRLIEDLLDLSRIQAGAVNPRADWCDLGEVVLGAAAEVEARRGTHPISIELDADVPLIRADAAQLERVFTNLLENAVRFSPSGSPVTVTGGVAGERVIVRITDQGPGIPPSQRPRVFEPFFRGRELGQQGAGLGLAICRGFVEANGGQLQLQADSGRGTAFAVSFPLVPQPQAVA